ncbi:restriction endonuclease subunit S [Janthinobacterium sp. LB2P10]|uniref:restriction endonuclease subunit S n=1 Tax=Janthinobacterium sp. LB2P10 TaxID=3424194 RepID=UPI003F21CFF2
MSHYKPYPAYKDSGVEWLGAIPIDWAVVPLKFLAVIKNGKDHKEVETADGEFPVIGSGGEFARASQCMFNGESVLLGRKGTIDRPLYVNGPFWSVDTMFYTEIGPKTSAKYFFYCTLTIQFNRYSTSTALPSMTQEVLGRILFAIPSHATQCAIVDHLDRETVRIDGLITKKTRFIELLREKRRALITSAVTKGLDPNAPMKDSGVEWLGDVPAHWDVYRLSFCVRLNPPEKPGLGLNDEVSFLPMEAIGTDGTLNLDRTRILAEVRAGYSYFEDGDIAFAKVTPCFENGKGAIMRNLVNGLGFGTTELTVLRPAININVDFLSYLIQSDRFRSFGAGAMTGAGGLKRVPDEFTRNFKTSWPDLAEQHAIAEYLDCVLNRMNMLISTTESSIELLKERRSALITAAVTGQIDLRETA